jgi:hypothetical protein
MIFCTFKPREIFEECGLTVEVEDLSYVAAIDFEFKDDPVILEVHVFLANKFKGSKAFIYFGRLITLTCCSRRGSGI